MKDKAKRTAIREITAEEKARIDRKVASGEWDSFDGLTDEREAICDAYLDAIGMKDRLIEARKRDPSERKAERERRFEIDSNGGYHYARKR